jgi:catechol 2,3-dioxygenase
LDRRAVRGLEGCYRVQPRVSFYRDVLGFGLMARLGSSATFLSAGGYHHHIGANTWESAGAPAPPERTVALRHATIVLPDKAERDAVLARVEDSGRPIEDSEDGPLVRDPSGNALVFAVARLRKAVGRHRSFA